MSAGPNSMDDGGVAIAAPAKMTTLSPTRSISAPSPGAATPPLSPSQEGRPAIKQEGDPGSCRSSRSPSPSSSSNNNHTSIDKKSPTHASYSSSALHPFNLLLQSITHPRPGFSDIMSSQGGSGSGSGSGSGGSQWNPILSHGSAIGIVKPNVVFDVYGNPQGSSSGSSGRGSSSSSGSNRGSSGGGSSRR